MTSITWRALGVGHPGTEGSLVTCGGDPPEFQDPDPPEFQDPTLAEIEQAVITLAHRIRKLRGEFDALVAGMAA
jgi:hypothetical protein